MRHWLIAGALLLLLVLVAAAWRFTFLRELLSPEQLEGAAQALQSLPFAVVWLVLAFTTAALCLIPLTLLLVQSGALLGAQLGITVSLLGIALAGSIAFGLGRLGSQRLLLRITGAQRLAGLFRRNAVLSIALMRVFPIAPFTIVNLVGGASPCSYRTFMLGSLLGLLPGVIALSWFGRGLFALVVGK